MPWVESTNGSDFEVVMCRCKLCEDPKKLLPQHMELCNACSEIIKKSLIWHND